MAASNYVLRGWCGAYGAGLRLVARFRSRGRRGTLRGRRGTWRHPPALCVAGVALGDIDLRLAWQAWHLVTSTFVSRGKRGTISHPRSFCVAGVALMALCVAGVALGDIHVRFTWQAWHLVTSTLVSRGRRGTWRHPPSFCVAGVALIALGWLWCHTPSLSRTIFHTLRRALCRALCHTLCHTPSFTHHL